MNPLRHRIAHLALVLGIGAASAAGLAACGSSAGNKGTVLNAPVTTSPTTAPPTTTHTTTPGGGVSY